MKKLFVEKPANKSGYRSTNAAVVEGEYIEGLGIHVTAPASFAGTVLAKENWQEVSANAGRPPRIPSIKEHQGDTIAWRDNIIRKYSV
jgi:hypothetical protein